MEVGGKIFGVGLPRTGTTSVSMAMIELGYRTGHVCFHESLYDQGDCFFDTPVYVDYPLLDKRYPNSKFILTWRDPKAWFVSFQKHLLPFFSPLKEENLGDAIVWKEMWRCYSAVFGRPETLTPYSLMLHYQRHRQEVEKYFRNRPNDLLILPVEGKDANWDALCKFLDKPRPDKPFPFLNRDDVRVWDGLSHEKKVPSWL